MVKFAITDLHENVFGFSAEVDGRLAFGYAASNGKVRYDYVPQLPDDLDVKLTASVMELQNKIRDAMTDQGWP